MSTPILSAEAMREHTRALDAAAKLCDNPARQEEGLKAWEKAEKAFMEAQREAICAWPYTYAGGEAPALGDIIHPEGWEEQSVVVALEPPELRVDSAGLGDLRSWAVQEGATVHPAMGRMIPRLCHLVRRALPTMTE